MGADSEHPLDRTLPAAGRTTRLGLVGELARTSEKCC